jgi:hypothetical protein
MYHLVFAALWVGLALFLWGTVPPEQRSSRLWGGGVAVALALYNLVQWWRDRRRASWREKEAALRRPRTDASPRPEGEPNPDFDFTKPE